MYVCACVRAIKRERHGERGKPGELCGPVLGSVCVCVCYGSTASTRGPRNSACTLRHLPQILHRNHTFMRHIYMIFWSHS